MLLDVFPEIPGCEIPDETMTSHPYIVGIRSDIAGGYVILCCDVQFCIVVNNGSMLYATSESFSLQMYMYGESWTGPQEVPEDSKAIVIAMLTPGKTFGMYYNELIYSSHNIAIVEGMSEDGTLIISSDRIAFPAYDNTDYEATMYAPYSFFKKYADLLRKKTGVNTDFNSTTLLDAYKAVPVATEEWAIPFETSVLSDEVVALLDGTVTDISNDQITELGRYKFYDRHDLVSVDFPNVTEIENSTFKNCTSLKAVNIPSVVRLENYAFQNCIELEEIDLPLVERIDYNAFSGCTKLANINAPKVTEIYSRAFDDCPLITSFTFYNSTTLHSNPFEKSGVHTLDFHKESPKSYYFELTNMVYLTTLIFRHESVYNGFNYMNIDNTPIAKGTGYIYVPASMVSAYKSDSFWKTYSSQIRAIEDYPDICGT